MSSYEIRPLPSTEFPPLLAEIPQPPKELWLAGNLPPTHLKLLAVVGSRKYTTYGKQAVEHLLDGLAGYPVGIVSGLALGIDALAHEAALTNNLYTMAVPGSGLDESVLYPPTNRRLAREIIDNGGGLLSELPPTAPAAIWTFPQRNRIMAGMSHATLLIEAGEKSGTLITARLAVDYNRELLAVPGSIFSKTSLGTHQFIKLGATPATCVEDILTVLGIETKGLDESKPRPTFSSYERLILNALREPMDKDSLIRSLNIDIPTANIVLMQMEMQGYISCNGGRYTACI